MRILFVVPRFHTNQYQMVKTLKEKGHEVYFHVASLGSTEDYSLLKPIRYNQCRASALLEKVLGKGGVNTPNYFPDPVKYWREIKQLKPEIVIVRDPYKIFSILAASFARLANAKVIFYTQEDMFRYRNRRTMIKQQLTISIFKAAWMTPAKSESHSERNRLKFMYHVPLPVPVKPVVHVKSRNLAQTGTRILMVGKYHQDRKNHLLLIKAINLLKSKYCFTVTMVGECIREVQIEKFNRIKTEVEKLGLNGIITLKCNIPFNRMEHLYSTHDVFVLPAKDELYGISVAEALGHGLPSICTDTTGARCNIINNENGYVVKTDSLDSLTEALESILSNRDKLLRMQLNSLIYSQNNLSGSAFYERFSHIIKDRFKLQSFN